MSDDDYLNERDLIDALGDRRRELVAGELALVRRNLRAVAYELARRPRRGPWHGLLIWIGRRRP